MKKNLSSKPFYKVYYYWAIILKNVSGQRVPQGREPEAHEIERMSHGVEEWLNQNIIANTRWDKPPVTFEKNGRWISVGEFTVPDNKTVARLTTIVETFQYEKKN